MVSPAELIKYPQTFHKSCPLFTGEQNVPIFGPNFDPDRLRTAVFGTAALYWKTKKLVKDR